VAISNGNGEFEIAYAKPGLKILVSVEGRAMASMFTVIPAVAEYHTITLMDGGNVRGPLIQNGTPVGNTEVGLMAAPAVVLAVTCG
jgi:hypothetical protein